jgi:uracil DNA glycosylase
MSKLMQYYADNVSSEWRDLLDKARFADLLLYADEEYKTKDLVPSNRFDLVSPFLVCPFNDLRVVIVGPAIEPSNSNSNGICMGGKSGYDSHGLKLIYQLSSEENKPIERFDYTMLSWARQGVLMINSVPVSSTSQYGKYDEKCREFTDKLLILLQEMHDKKPMVFVYIDYDGQIKNLRIAVHRFKGEYLYGSDFFEKINKSLGFIKQKPVDWMAIKRENILYDVKKFMTKSRNS